MMRVRFVSLCAAALLLQRPLAAETTQPVDDAAKLYASAASIVEGSRIAGVVCPTNSNMEIIGYLPSIPLDAFGDGKQTLGYVLIKNGLPDGSDRPLFYSRDNSKDGLFFRTDRALYSFYVGDGSTKPWKQQKQGGEFRDVTGWVAVVGQTPSSTTQPLEK